MSINKGIILAAGKATRLQPATLAFGKPLLPLFDKPMIYYPLSLLIESGLRDILIITSPRDRQLFELLLGDGSQFGIRIMLREQPAARGIADAFLIGEDFAGEDPVCLFLGDNFFYTPEAPSLADRIAEAGRGTTGATIFCAHVDDPRAFGVATLDAAGAVTALEEKPEQPQSSWAVTGLYLYSGGAADAARTLTPSKRGELEITDLNIRYMARGALNAVTLPRSLVWMDLGTHDSMLEAAQFVAAEEKRTGRKIGCPHTAAFQKGFISRDQLLANAADMKNPAYASYLRNLAG